MPTRLSGDSRPPRCHCRPSAAVTNLHDGLLADARNDREGVSRDPLREQSANVDDAFAGQLRHRRLLAPEVNQSNFPLMLGVPCKAHPLQILGTIVQPIAIDVVDRQTILEARAEGQSDEPMHALLHALALLQDRHLEVSVAGHARSDLSLRKAAAERRHFAISHPGVWRLMRRRFHSRVRRDHPSQSLGLDGAPLFNLCHMGVISAWQT